MRLSTMPPRLRGRDDADRPLLPLLGQPRLPAGSDGTKGSAGVGQVDTDGIARADLTACAYDGHDSGAPPQLTVVRPVQDGGHEPRANLVELPARVSQAGQLHFGLRPQPQHRAGRQGEEVDARSEHVLAHLARQERQSSL